MIKLSPLTRYQLFVSLNILFVVLQLFILFDTIFRYKKAYLMRRRCQHYKYIIMNFCFQSHNILQNSFDTLQFNNTVHIHSFIMRHILYLKNNNSNTPTNLLTLINYKTTIHKQQTHYHSYLMISRNHTDMSYME